MWIVCFCLLLVLILVVYASFWSVKESFVTASPVPAPCCGQPSSSAFDPSLSTFDNLLLSNPTNKNTFQKVATVYQGAELPSTFFPLTSVSDAEDPSATTIDGTPDSARSKFMFAFNKCKPECCPSTFSCDSGCVCTTPAQNDFLATRGNNRHFDIW